MQHMQALMRSNRTVTFRSVNIICTSCSLDTAGKTNEMSVKRIPWETSFITHPHKGLFIKHWSNYKEYDIWKTKAHLHLTVVHTGQRHVLHFHLQKLQEKALLSTCCSAAVMGWGEAETTTSQTKEDKHRHRQGMRQQYMIPAAFIKAYKKSPHRVFQDLLIIFWTNEYINDTHRCKKLLEEWVILHALPRIRAVYTAYSKHSHIISQCLRLFHINKVNRYHIMLLIDDWSR